MPFRPAISMVLAVALLATVPFLVSGCQSGESRLANAPGPESERTHSPLLTQNKFLTEQAVDGSDDATLGAKYNYFAHYEKRSPRAGRPRPVFVPGEELWIIEAPVSATPPAGDDTPGTGSLLARRASGEEQVPIPLEHTQVTAAVSGYIATVDVVQKFRNPYDTKIEASYVFPLPQNAAVSDFIMTIGERRIRGIVRERQEAEAIYKDARSQGYVASLMTQERPNIFTQAVANIEAGKTIDVTIRYFHTLAYVDGWYEMVFPMVVGPRYNPPGFRDGVGAVSWPQGRSSQPTSVSYLRPEERSGHDISLTVNLDAGVTIEELECPTHAIVVEERSDHGARVSLSPHDSIPNRDFVLRYRVTGKELKSALFTHRDARGGFFTLMLYPPEETRRIPRRPMEMIFVLDCSGSMKGHPLAKARRAASRALCGLGTGDTFQIIRFSSSTSALGPEPLAATGANVRRGLDYLESLRGGGGTEMIRGVCAALDFPHDPERLRVVSFMTDGFIGNELEIFRAIQSRIGSARLFSFGVGNSVNRYLLEGMARMGRGAVAYVGLDEDSGRAVDAFYERLRHPVITDLAVTGDAIEIHDVFPERLPDLFVGRPVIITGRLRGDDAGFIHVTGRQGDEELRFSYPVKADLPREHAGLPNIWARSKIATLSRTSVRYPGEDTSSGIREVALEFGILSRHTAFVAVDTATRTEGDHGISVPVPVPVPDGVRYDTTVKD